MTCDTAYKLIGCGSCPIDILNPIFIEKASVFTILNVLLALFDIDNITEWTINITLSKVMCNGHVTPVVYKDGDGSSANRINSQVIRSILITWHYLHRHEYNTPQYDLIEECLQIIKYYTVIEPTIFEVRYTLTRLINHRY